MSAFAGRRKHVILGGRGKAEPYDGLALAFEPGDRAYLVGEAIDEIAVALEAHGVPHVVTGTVARSLQEAQADASAGDVILLSPACASFDQFKDYEARGDAFRAAVEKLA